MTRRPTLAEAAAVFRDAFSYDPGHSDLDDEQPIAVHVTLGDWRRLDRALSASDPDLKERELIARNAYNCAIHEAAQECEAIWRDAPNDRENGFLQNQLSHGCIASAKAVRALKQTDDAEE